MPLNLWLRCSCHIILCSWAQAPFFKNVYLPVNDDTVVRFAASVLDVHMHQPKKRHYYLLVQLFAVHYRGFGQLTSDNESCTRQFQQWLDMETVQYL